MRRSPARASPYDSLCEKRGFYLEVDITERVKYLLKYGLVGMLLLAFLGAGGVWYYQNRYHTLRIYDAKVTSTMVGIKVFAGGKIKEFLVSDGDHVEAGQPLAHVEVSVTEEQIAQLEQTVELSKQNLAQVIQGQVVTIPVYESGGGASGADIARAEERMNRMNELFEMGAISANKRDEAAAEYAAALSAVSVPSVTYRTTVQPSAPEVIESAEIALRQAEAALENARKASQATEITAPVEGTVYYTELSEGSDVRAGQTILSIGDGGRIWLEASITPEQKSKLQLGQLVSYELADRELEGTIIEFDTPAESGEAANTEAGPQEESGNEDDRKIIVKISLPTNVSFDYKPGMATTVKVKLTGGNVS